MSKAAEENRGQTRTEAIRVGVVGLGMGTAHARAYREVPECELVALCDVNQELLKSRATELGVAKTFTDAQGLFESGKVDLVSIATPNALHHPLTMAALDAGLHVLCEKPMAMNATQAREMVQKAEAVGRKLAIHFNHRMRPCVQLLARYAQAGALGDIYFARTFWHRRRGIPARASFLQTRSNGGGCLIDLGVHMLDQALYVMGYPRVVSVTASVTRRFDRKYVPHLPMDVEDFSSAYLRFDNGAAMVMEISWASHHHHPEQYGFDIYGSEGGARRLTENYQDVDVSLHRFEHGALVSTQLVGQHVDGVKSVQADLVQAIRAGREPACSGAHGLETMRILDAIYESSRLGAEVRLDDAPADKLSPA